MDYTDRITYFGHDSFMIKGTKNIYIDPYDLPYESEKADVILITHGHYDHLSVKDISRISTENTRIIITPDCQSKLSDFPGTVVLAEPEKRYSIEDIKIMTVPAYNMGKKFHPKENDWVGYIIDLDKRRYYHAGDTDLVPEMELIEDVDVAFLPVSGTYVMNAKEAAKAAEMISPRVAIPMHYGKIIGTIADAKEFQEEYSGYSEILEEKSSDENKNTEP